METQPPPGPVYICPMHPDVRMPGPGKCPKCGMDLLPEGARFAMLRHMLGHPMRLAIMLAAMLGLIAAVMMLLA